MYRPAIVVCTAVLLMTVGCQGPSDSTPANTGTTGQSDYATAHVVVRLVSRPNARPTPADVERVMLQITWDGGQTPTEEMTQTGPDTWELVVEALPVDIPCTVHAEAFDSTDNIIYSAHVEDVVFQAEDVVEMILNLINVSDGTDEGQGPHIDTVSRPGEPIAMGSLVPLVFVVGDPDDAALDYQLTSTADGSFTPSSGSLALTEGTATLETMYTAPSTVGSAMVNLHIQDGAGLSVEFSFSMMVVEPPPLAPGGAGEFSVNFPPVISQVEARADASGATIEVLATIADDGPPEELTVQWWLDGEFYAEGNPIMVDADTGVVTVTVTVVDGLSASSTLALHLDTATTTIIDLPVTNQPPQIVVAYLSQQDVSYGDTVIAKLYALDPDDQPLTAEWSTTHGSISSTTSYESVGFQVFEAHWEAAEEAGVAQLSGVISDPLNATVEHVFEINQVLGMIGITADAGLDLEAFVEGSFMLDGSGSSSEDGLITDWLWEQISGPDSTIETPDQPMTTVSPTSTGTYVYRLTVNNVNNSALDTVTVTVINPLAFSFIDADMSDDGMIYFLDTTSRRIRRYDADQVTFLPSYSTGDGVYRFAVAPEGDAVYVGYQGGRMDVIDTATGETSFFANAPDTVLRMAVIEDYVFTIDPSGAWESHSLYARSNGLRTFSDEWRNNSNGVAYATSLQRIFTFRDGTSPNDIIRTDVDLEAGTLGPAIDSPYHGDYSFWHPMRLFPDQATIAVGSGVIFSTADLTYAGSLGMSYVDMRFHGDEIYLINEIGGQTELIQMNPDFSIQDVSYHSGEALRLFIHDDRIHLITSQGANLLGIEVIDVGDQ